MSGVTHYLVREYAGSKLACNATDPEYVTTTRRAEDVTCKRCQRVLGIKQPPPQVENIEWWTPPSDDDARHGADVLELMMEEIHALIEHHMGERWIMQKMIEHGGEDPEQRQRHERWLSYHQARIRQLKMLEAEAEADSARYRKEQQAR